jgi:hypothetical protein
VDTDSRLIVGQRVSQSPNDKQELAEDLKAVKENVSPAIVLVDSGFVSESAVSIIEAENPGLEVLAAMKREPHGRTVKQLEKSENPEPPPVDADFGDKMKYRTSTASGRALYRLRQQTVEPIFGIIKEAMGFRRFSLRGHAKVSLESGLPGLQLQTPPHRWSQAPRGMMEARPSPFDKDQAPMTECRPCKNQKARFLKNEKSEFRSFRFLTPTGC